MPPNRQKIHAFKDALRKTKWPFCRRKTCRRLFLPKPGKDVLTLDSSETDPVIQINPVGIVEEFVKPKFQGSISRGYFLVIFSSHTDHERIFQRGLCFLKLAGLYMTYWTTGFDPRVDILSKTLVWVWLPFLPFKFWKYYSLNQNSDGLGSFIQPSQLTSEKKMRTRYPRSQQIHYGENYYQNWS